jgi:hypothetical protein
MNDQPGPVRKDRGDLGILPRFDFGSLAGRVLHLLEVGSSHALRVLLWQPIRTRG